MLKGWQDFTGGAEKEFIAGDTRWLVQVRWFTDGSAELGIFNEPDDITWAIVGKIPFDTKEEALTAANAIIAGRDK